MPTCRDSLQGPSAGIERGVLLRGPAAGGEPERRGSEPSDARTGPALTPRLAQGSWPGTFSAERRTKRARIAHISNCMVIVKGKSWTSIHLP